MRTQSTLFEQLSTSVPRLSGDTSSESWPLRVNTGVDLGFGFDFGDFPSFRGSINFFSAFGFRVFSVNCESHLVYRENSHLREDGFYILSLQISGKKTIEQQGRTAQIGQGEFSLYDSAVPVNLHIGDDYRSVNVRFPKRALAPTDQNTLDALSLEGFSVRDGIAPLVWTTLLGLRYCSEDLVRYTDVQHSLMEMMVLMMKARTSSAGDSRNDAKLDALKQFIRSNLGDSNLSVEAIAQANYLSIRTVHKLFAESGDTPAAWIRDQRVQSAKRLLVDAEPRTITEIAQLCGFSSIAQFSYVFKQLSGATPTQYRDDHRASPTGSPEEGPA